MTTRRSLSIGSLALLAVGTAACTSRPDEETLSCTTPEDATATADYTVTVEDTVIEPEQDVHFAAWTYGGGLPGPVLRLPLGETRKIKLENHSPRPASLHFHGVAYAARDDGSPDSSESMENPSMVNPGCAHVYTVTAVQPGVWPYHSHREPRTEMARGLYGAVVVPFPGEAAADHEFVVFLGQLGIEQEHSGGAEEAEAAEEGGGAPEGFFMTINGLPFGAGPVIEWKGDHACTGGGNACYEATAGAKASAKVGERVRFRVLNVSPDDPHTFHLHGHRWCDRGHVADASGACPAGSLPIDNVDLLPAQGTSLEFVEDSAGEWMYHCHIVDHVVDGMFAFYSVTN